MEKLLAQGLQRLTQVVLKLIEINYRGSIVIVIDIDTESKSIKFREQVQPIL